MRLNNLTAVLWATVLLSAGFASNLFLTCGANLVGFALVAALTLGFRRGSLVALGIWLESQVLGFAVFGYPHSSLTVAWGIALGAGTLLAAAVGGACAPCGPFVAFALAFVMYEAALAAFALASDGGLSAFSPAIVGQLVLSNGALTLGLAVLYRVAEFADAGIAQILSRPRNT